MSDHEAAPNAGEPPIGAADLGDADLVLRARSGDTRAFGELWRRHYRSGIVVARNVSPGTDADDLVQEAYTRIYQSIQRGGGPTGSFRAYLFTSIRNTAAGWGRTRHETTMEELETLEDPATSEQATAEALDRGLTHQAFRSLPSRWQEVLWYSEIEGMKPAEIAPLLGMKPTAVAQLTFRAREGLREAWIQAHLRAVADDSDCAWTIARLGAYSRNNIGRRDRARLEAHVATCARCAIVASEAHEVSGRLTFVLIPLTVGVAGTAGYLATLQGGGAPIVALAAMPSSVVQGAATAGSGLGATAGSGTLAGAASTAGSGSGVAAGSSVAAGSAGAASAASSAGAAVGTAVAGAAATATATGATVAAGGALTTVGVAGFAAATLVVAGSVVAAVALPDAAGQQATASVRTVSDSGSTDAARADDGGGVSLPPEGPSPADIPVLPGDDTADAGSTGGNGGDAPSTGGSESGADTASGDGEPGTPSTGDDDPGIDNAGSGSTPNSADSGSGSTPNGTGSGNGSTPNGTGSGHGKPGDSTSPGNDDPDGNGTGHGNGTGTGNGGSGGDNAVDGNTGNGNTGGGSGLTGSNNGTVSSGNANSGAGNNNGVGPAGLPGGSPSIESSSSSEADGQTTIALVAIGAPGGTVQVRIRGIVHGTETLGADGRATVLVQPTARDLAIDARLELRYVSGDTMGIPVSARLSALV